MMVMALTDVNIVEIISAIVGANCQLPLAAERLRKRGIQCDPESLLAHIANDNQAPELLAKQLRMQTTLSTYGLLQLYQAALIEQQDNEQRSTTPNENVAAFNAVAGLFNSLTQAAGTGSGVNVNIMDRVLTMLPPEAREAVHALAAKEIDVPLPTPIRKRGRPASDSASDSASLELTMTNSHAEIN